VTSASVERRGRDVAGIAAMAVGGIFFVVSVWTYLHSPRGILPF
jgi:hypothetical protein